MGSRTEPPDAELLRQAQELEGQVAAALPDLPTYAEARRWVAAQRSRAPRLLVGCIARADQLRWLLVARVTAMAWALARRMMPTEAGDTAQDLLVAAFEATFEWRPDVLPWARCAWNRMFTVCATLSRKAGRLRHRVVCMDGPEQASDLRTDDAASARERARRVHRALRRLPPKARKLLRLRYTGLGVNTFASVGRALGVARQTAQYRHAQALGQLRPILEDLK